MKTIIEFFVNYGAVLGLLAFSGMVLLGILKKCGVFKKVKEDYRKYVYFACSCVLSIIACTIYILAINSFEIVEYLIMCAGVISLTLTAYGIYENTGARVLWNKFVDFMIKVIKKLATLGKVDKEKIKKALAELSLEELKEIEKQVEEKKAEESKISVAKEV